MPGRDRSWRTWRSSSTSRGRRPRSRSARRARLARGGPRRTPRGWPWPPSLLLQRGELVDDRACRRVRLEVVVPRGLADAEDLADRADRLGGLRRLAVPLGVVLHERDPLALDGVGHDERRRPPGGLRLIERFVDVVHVVPVDLEDGPAERLPLRHDRLEVHDLRHEVVELDFVVVEDHAEVVERTVGLAELRPRHRRLPHLAFLGLAVAEDAVDARAGGAELAGDRFETRVSHQSSSSMHAAISSTRTPRTAISGAYTTSSAAQTIVPRTSLVMPTMLLRIFPMFSLIRIAFAFSGAASRPSRMI